MDDSGPPSTDEEKMTAETSEAFPEGGLVGWATVVGAFISQFCGFGYINSYGVYQDFYTRVYLRGKSPSTISWVGGVNMFLALCGSLVSGKLYDQGHFHILVYGGSLLISFSLFMLSLAQPGQFYQIFLSQGLGVGLGVGMMYVPSLAILSHYFEKRRAMAMAVVASGASLGAVLHPIMLNNTLHGHLGFAKATRENAGLISGLLIISCLLMRTRLPPSRNPARLGNLLKRFSKDAPYIAATTGITISMIGIYFPLFYLQLDTASHGLNKNFVFYSLVILNSSSFAGRFCSAFFAPKIGVMNAVVMAVGCCSVLVFGILGLTNVAGFTSIAIIYGFCGGIYIALMAPLMAILSPNVSELGARIGVSFAFSAFGSLIGPPIQGALLGTGLKWWRPVVFSGAMVVIGFSCLLFMSLVFRRQRNMVL